jgi:hypothetical protein
MAGDQVTVVEGDVEERKFVAAFGLGGRTVGALCFSWPARLARYRRLVAAATPFPPAPGEVPLAPGSPGGAA